MLRASQQPPALQQSSSLANAAHGPSAGRRQSSARSIAVRLIATCPRQNCIDIALAAITCSDAAACPGQWSQMPQAVLICSQVGGPVTEPMRLLRRYLLRNTRQSLQIAKSRGTWRSSRRHRCKAGSGGRHRVSIEVQ